MKPSPFHMGGDTSHDVKNEKLLKLKLLTSFKSFYIKHAISDDILTHFVTKKVCRLIQTFQKYWLPCS
jgi:hypothetical protein